VNRDAVRAELTLSGADTTSVETLLDQAADALEALEPDYLIAFARVQVATAREGLELRRRWSTRLETGP
jgi:hypothetical protein